MYTQPSVAELLEGVRRNLDHELLPMLDDHPDAQRLVLPMLAVLDRAAAEAGDRVPALAADTRLLVGVLDELATRAAGRDGGPAVRALVDGLPPAPADGTVDEWAAANHAARAALVEAMDLLGLPAAADAPPALGDIDAFVLGALIDYADRELAAIPQVSRAEVMARMNHSMAGMPIGDMPDRLAAFLEHELAGECEPGSVRVPVLDRLAGGNSRDTYLVQIDYRTADGRDVREKCVMQREAVSSVLDTDAVEGVIDGTRRRPETEFKAVRAVERAGLKVPHMLCCDPTGDWLDRPFTLARVEAGATPDVELRAGDPAKLARVYDDYVQTVAALHSLDVDELDVGFLGGMTCADAARSQVELFEAAFRKNAREIYPGVEYLIRWLRANTPTAHEISLIHGDFRRGNFLIDDDRVTAYIDWEQVHLGDPTEEIAFMYWAMWSLEPVLTLDEFLSRYEAARGITVDRDLLAFWRMFLELKMLVVGVTGINSYFASPNRQLAYTDPYGHTFTTECYRRTLVELQLGGPSYDFPAGKDAPLLY